MHVINVQILINGILYGTVYAIAAIGLSVIYGTMRLIFLAQGAFMVFFAYISYWLLTLWGIDPYLSIIIIFALSYPLGLGLYYFLFKESAAAEDKNISLLIAVGLIYLMDNLMLVLWTADPRSPVTAYSSITLQFLGLIVPLTRAIGLGIALLSAVGLVFFLKRTFVGTAVRAASEDMVSTTLMGIDPDRVNAMVFGIGIGMASLAGVVMATIFPFDPSFGFTFSIKALVAVALGGIGSVYGSFLGGLLLGVVETFGAYYVGPGWTDALFYGVFLLFLLFRPEGILGGSIKKA